MRILSIGTGIDNEIVDDVVFRDRTSALDYDIVVWEPAQVLDGYRRPIYNDGKYMGYPLLDQHDSIGALEDIARRKNEVAEMLNLGRTVVIFTPPPTKFYIYTGEKRYSGTGKSRQTTNLVVPFELMDALPFDDIDTVEASGTNLEFKGQAPFKSFWDKTKDLYYYQAYFKKWKGVPLLQIKGTDKVVACYFSFGKGHVLFLPSLSLPEEDYEEAENTFVSALLSLVTELKATTGDFSLPTWANTFTLTEENQALHALSLLENEMSELAAKISRQKEAILKIEENKLLFVGSGKALEVQVKNVFIELGFSVTEGLPGRDDLILEYDGKVAVVEVKGVSKSAAEKHAAQLEKWVSEYFSKRSVSPKGILVVNTFKDTPLNQRQEDDFPNQMLGYSQRREHCLLTGLQLLGLLLAFRDKPEKRQQIIDSLFTTVGHYPEYKNWRAFLTDGTVGVDEDASEAIDKGPEEAK